MRCVMIKNNKTFLVRVFNNAETDADSCYAYGLARVDPAKLKRGKSGRSYTIGDRMYPSKVRGSWVETVTGLFFGHANYVGVVEGIEGFETAEKAMLEKHFNRQVLQTISHRPDKIGKLVGGELVAANNESVWLFTVIEVWFRPEATGKIKKSKPVKPVVRRTPVTKTTIKESSYRRAQALMMTRALDPS